MKSCFKGMTSTILVLCMIFTVITVPVVFADGEPPITVFVDGVQLNFDVNPVTQDDRTLVPMRYIFEALGATVTWDDEARTATAIKDDDTIVITVDSTKMSKNGQEIILDVPARLIDARVLVPVRAVSEGLGATVAWEENTRKVTITKAVEEIPAPTATPEPTTPTAIPTVTKYYERNSLIPDYGDTMNEELLGTWEPDQYSKEWVYRYKYDKSKLDSYISILTNQNFKNTYSKQSEDGRFYFQYFEIDADGAYLIYDKTYEELRVGLWEDVGTAEPNLTKSNDEYYKDNSNVPNFECITGLKALRFDAGKTLSEDTIARYTYPYESASFLKYSTYLMDNGWEFIGGSGYNAAVMVLNYSNGKDIISLIENKADNLVMLAFNVK